MAPPHCGNLLLGVVVAETMRDDHAVKAGSEYLASFQAGGGIKPVLKGSLPSEGAQG